ncbi:GAF domain-containing protein, partial [candidate division WOR-3 bacterium]|nr:GAF domain-containing protein [candidate division WOR-3 bacterium]
MTIIIAAIILQIASALWALKQASKSSAPGWLFIAIPLLLMGIVKSMDLAGIPVGIKPEILTLFVGTSMFLGLIFVSRIFQTHQKTLALSKAIRDIERVMLSSLSDNGVINAVMDKLNQTIQPAAVGIYKYDKAGRKLNVLKTHNLSCEFQAQISADGNEFIKSVIENKRTLIIDKFAEDENAGFIPLLKKEGFTGYVGTPIVSKGGVPIGALALYLKRPRKYSKDDIEFVKTMGSQVAIALDRAQFIDRIHEMNFESVYSLVQAIEMRDPYTRGHSL